MSNTETALFQSFLNCASIYTEFGCGGSTVLATQTVPGAVFAIDSSPAWLTQVSEACKTHSRQPELIHADIGATGDWGMPTDASTRERWPSYHEKIWEDSRSMDADLFLVDGRFRVACFIQIIRRCRQNSLIMIHDFLSREYYHVVREIGREVARAGDLSVFLPKLPNNPVSLKLMLDAYKYDPA